MRLLKEKKDREVAMVSNKKKKALRDYVVPSLMRATSCIKKLTIQIDNFELKTLN